MERGVRQHEPDERAPRRDLRRERRARRGGGSRTIGRSTDARSASSAGDEVGEARAAARSRTITASGFSSRRFRSRSVRTAAGEVASQARW